MNDSAETHTPSPPRLLVFDMDDVMLRYDVDARRAAMARMAGLSIADIERLIWTSGIEDASDTGELSPDAYVAAIGEALGVPFGREDWLRTRALAMTLDMEMVNLVAELSGRVAIALLTNNGFIMREHFDVLVPGLREVFGPAMHVAAEFGGKKPAPAIYKGVAAFYGVAPEEAVMVDDKIANVEGALAAGLRAHCFTGIDELRRFLRDLSI